MSEQPMSPGFHLLEEGQWEETAMLPKIRLSDLEAEGRRRAAAGRVHQATPVMPDDEAPTA